MFIEILKSIFLGIIEGITEWLPISSTGHLIIVNEFVKLDVSEQFWSVYEVVIQLGAILAVIALFLKKLLPFGFGKTKPERVSTWKLWFKIALACVPAAIIGFFIDDWIDAHLYNYVVVAAALILYGVLFIVMERLNKNKKPEINTVDDFTYGTALKIGLFQLLAFIPGTSRSGSTILGGMWIGTSRPAAAEFSFFLAIPIMLGASGLKIVKYILEYGVAFSFVEMMLLAVGMLTAFIVSFVAIKFLVSFVRKHSFEAFGWYRIVLGVVVLGYFALKQFVL